MDRFSKAADAWHFLKSHYFFQDGDEVVLEKCLDLEVREVNPATGTVDADPAKNTATHWFLKCSMWYKSKDTGLDEPLVVSAPEFDCDAPTIEEAIIKLANLIDGKYKSG